MVEAGCIRVSCPFVAVDRRDNSQLFSMGYMRRIEVEGHPSHDSLIAFVR